MKKLNVIFLLLLTCTFFACSKSDDGNDSSSEGAKYSAVSGKYDVNGSSSFSSIEFSEGGTYIIIKKSAASAKSLQRLSLRCGFFGLGKKQALTRSVSSDILTGTYTYDTSTGVFTLSGFGTITISSDNQTMKITYVDGTTETLTVTKESNNGTGVTSSLTNAVCRNWHPVSSNSKYYINGVLSFSYSSSFDVSAGIGTYDDIEYNADGKSVYSEDKGNMSDDEFVVSVLLSRAGTYMSTYRDGKVEMGSWYWVSNNVMALPVDDNGKIGIEQATVSISGNIMKMNYDFTLTEGSDKCHFVGELIMQAAD